ncbi:uncharacterized protein LOC119554452 [Drosophila subpulchrella]|uniref:uncharacterized protein LOC119554452 n=1 Tax=Drosophila subpulchrella TaxID=1486046 RepID=UPI0018A19B9D|nr:uncharacterized protein LOC119554452 [Drosophila subpulchrella]
MPESSIFLFLIFLLFLFTTCAAFKKDLVLCVDCNKDNFDTCKIESDSGHFVAPKGSAALRSFRSSFSLPTTTDLDVCIPTNMKIDAKNDFEYICVWSRELGCQMLVPKNTKTELDCAICQVNVVGKLKTCPCKPLEVNLDIGIDIGKKKEKSGSRQLYPGYLHIMIAAFVLQQQILMGLKLGGL